MANSTDFRADQVQTSKIIVTGSTPQKTLLIYGIAADGSPANQGNIDPTVFDTSVVGSDVFLFVSGTAGGRGGTDPNITVIGGDLHISGNLSIDGTGGGGGPSFFTEIAFEAIETTGSVAMTYLSASTGGEITGSFAQGDSTTASGVISHAEGFSTTANGIGSHSEGFSTTANGNFSHAEGHNTTANGNFSHAEGYNTEASGSYSHAEGVLTITSGSYSHAEGEETKTEGDSSHAEGYQTIAIGYSSHAEGNSTTAVGDDSHAEGQSTIANGIGSHAEGYVTTTNGAYSHAEGYQSEASGAYSHAEGYKTQAKGTGSFSAGLETIAYGAMDGVSPLTTTQAVFGKYNVANNATSLFVVGDGFNDSNRHDVLRVNSGSVQVIGSLIASMITGSISGTVNGDPFIVAGANITANYNSFGQWEITSSGGGGGGTNFFTEIDSTNIFTTSSVQVARLSASLGAIITGSLTQGAAGNNATGLNSHAEGDQTSTIGTYSHAEGYSTTVTGDYSHAEGYSTTVTGDYSHAEGRSTTAFGQYSHAEGVDTIAFGTGSLAAGLGTVASGAVDGAALQTTVQAAFGKYNLENNTDSLFVVGDGLDLSNRHDVLRVNSGSVQVTGSLEVLGGITGSISGTAGGLPFIVAGTNIITNYSSLGQWEIKGSSVNFFTAIDSTNIFTTSSVQVARLSASLGAIITGSVVQGIVGNIASGQYSHAEGGFTIASGDYSHAEGFGTTAFGTGSLAAGLGTVASGAVGGGPIQTTVQAAFGKYNLGNNTDSLFVVGDGLNSSNRHDILRVNSGSVQVTGSLEVLGGITGSLSGTVAGNPFIVAGSNITASYNSLGQWEITGSGGANFWTELDSSNIFTTSSVQVARLSASLGAIVTGSLIASRITGSLRETVAGNPFIVAGSNVKTNYNSLGQWEITSSVQKLSIAGYNRTNLTTPTVIGLAYYNPLEYQNVSNLSLSAVGMNMAGVSGGLDLYDQSNATLVASLTWSGNSTLTTGSYQTTTFGIAAFATTYELHFSQSGGANGGTDYSTVGFVNFVLS